MEKVFSDKELNQLREYLKIIEELKATEPPRIEDRITPEEYDAALDYLFTGKGEKPPYTELFEEGTVTMGSVTCKTYYDKEWEAWNKKIADTNREYKDIVINALKKELSVTPTTELARSETITELLNSFLATIDPSRPSTTNPRDVAIEKGALMTIGGHIASYSSDNLADALNAFSIFQLPVNRDIKECFDSAGKLNMLIVPKEQLEELSKIYTAFLGAIAQAVSLADQDGENNTITFYVPTICREMGIDPRGYSERRTESTNLADLRRDALISIISQFELLVGRTPDGSYYRVLSFTSYEKESETMTISAPYIFKLAEIANNQAIEAKRSQLNQLLHGNVVNEPNSAAVELASCILTGVLRRGTATDYKTDTESIEKSGIITYRVKFSTLISRCPQLSKALEAIEKGKDENGNDKKNKTQAYNSKLKQTFEAAYRIIEKKSDAPNKYDDFKMPKTQRTVKGQRKECYDIPTKSTLSRQMVIKYKKKQAR